MQTLDTQGEGERKLHNDLNKQSSKEVQIPNKCVLKWLMSVATISPECKQLQNQEKKFLEIKRADGGKCWQ